MGISGKYRVGSDTIDANTPHPYFAFVSPTKDNRLCAKEVIGKQAVSLSNPNRQRLTRKSPPCKQILLHVGSEIEKLMGSLIGTNNVLLSYVNVKIAELDRFNQELVKQIAELAVKSYQSGTGQTDFRLPRHMGQRLL